MPSKRAREENGQQLVGAVFVGGVERAQRQKHIDRINAQHVEILKEKMSTMKRDILLTELENEVRTATPRLLCVSLLSLLSLLARPVHCAVCDVCLSRSLSE